MNRIKAIIFDFDGTLANRADYAGKELRTFAKQYFPELPDDSIELEGIVQDLITWDGFGFNRKTFVAEEFYKKHHIDGDPLKYNRWWLDNMLGYCSLFEDTIDTLEYLKDKYKLAIITNGESKEQHGKIDLTGINDYFDEILASYDIGIDKPDPRIFTYMCDKLGVKPEEAVYVGDTFSYDIVGSYKAGLTPVWMCTDPMRPCDANVTRISRISELKELY